VRQPLGVTRRLQLTEQTGRLGPEERLAGSSNRRLINIDGDGRLSFEDPQLKGRVATDE
jgi:hypothetical protein